MLIDASTAHAELENNLVSRPCRLARERPLTTTSSAFGLVDTMKFNGYENEVGYMYTPSNLTGYPAITNSRALWM
jgi:hypothetical protein